MHQNAQKSKHFLSPTSSMGYAAQGYQSSSSRLPVKIPILICSMVLHAYLFFSALEKIRQLRVQSIIPVGCGSETEGYMTLPEHFPSVINFQNLHVKKGLVSHAHQIHALWIPSTKFRFWFSPGKRKSYYIIVGDLQWFRGVYCFTLILHWLGKKVGKYIFSRSPDGLNSHLFNPDLEKQ